MEERQALYKQFLSNEDEWYDLYIIHKKRLELNLYTIHPHRWLSHCTNKAWMNFYHELHTLENQIKVGSITIKDTKTLFQVVETYKERQKDSFYHASYKGAKMFLDHIEWTSFKKEMWIQDRLWEKNNTYQFEVGTEFGRIDCMTDTEIIEIKNIKSWKHGFGQLLVYATYYSGYNRKLYLYGKVKKPNKLDKIKYICEKYNIKVLYEDIS